MPRGAGATNTDPHHSGTDDAEGGPLWLRYQAYGSLLPLCQDHLPVLTTAVLVPLGTPREQGFPKYGEWGQQRGPEIEHEHHRQPDCLRVGGRLVIVWVSVLGADRP